MKIATIYGILIQIPAKAMFYIKKCAAVENIENKYVVIEVATKSKIAAFSMTGLPGCCGVCVSHYSHVANRFQGKGLGTLLCGIRKDIAKTMRYSCLLCTDVDDNLPQQRILDRHGWKKSS